MKSKLLLAVAAAIVAAAVFAGRVQPYRTREIVRRVEQVEIPARHEDVASAKLWVLLADIGANLKKTKGI